MKRLIIFALMLLGAVANAQTTFPIADTTTTKTRLKGQLNVFTLTQDASGQTWIVTTPKSYKFNTDATVVPNSRTLGFSGADGISVTGGTQNLTANRTWTIGISSIDASKIGGGAVSNIEYSYLDGVTSAIQTQLNSISSNATHSNRSILDATTASYTTDDKTNLDANTSARHTHSNKTTLDNITAAYTTAEQSKLSELPTNSSLTTSLDSKLESNGYSISELRNLTTAKLAATIRFYCNEAGKEGYFVYDASDNSTADNTGTVLVTTSGKRLKRVVTDGLYYVEWFGGTGSNSMFDNSSIINSMISTWIPTGGVLKFRAGNYGIKTKINYTRSIPIEGFGQYNNSVALANQNEITRITYTADSTINSIFNLSGSVNGLKISNIIIQGLGKVNHGIDIDRTKYGDFRNITIENTILSGIRIKPRTNDGIKADNAMWNNFTNISINVQNINTSVGILLDGFDGTQFSTLPYQDGNACHNTFQNIRIQHSLNGVKLLDSDNNTFNSLYVYHSSSVTTPDIYFGENTTITSVANKPSSDVGKARNNYFYHSQGNMTAENGMKNYVYGYDELNSQIDPLVKNNSIVAVAQTDEIDRDFLKGSFCISKYETEKFANKGHNVTIFPYIYTTYLANDGDTRENVSGQLVRLSKVNILNQNDRTFYDVVVPGSTINLEGTNVTVNSTNVPKQCNMLLLNDGVTLRIFSFTYVYADYYYMYRDFNTSTSTFTNFTLVLMQTKKSPIGYITGTTTFDHVDWFVAGQPAAGVSYTANVMNTTAKDVAMMNITKEGSEYLAILNAGNTSEKNVSSILISSTNQGATWIATAVFDPRDLSGTTGTNNKWLFDGAITLYSNNFYIFLRGAPKTQPATGTYMFTVPTSNRYTSTANGKVLDYGTTKLATFKLFNNYYLVNEEDETTYLGTNNQQRTRASIHKIQSNGSLIRVKGFADSRGVHQYQATALNDINYMTYSTSLSRVAQATTPAVYAGTTHIMAKLIKQDDF